MLYVIFILAFIGFGVLTWWSMESMQSISLITAIVGVVGAIIFGLITIVTTITVINENVCSDTLYEKYTTRKAALEWRLEQDYTVNDNNLGATELYKEIQEYNEDLAAAKANRDNAWLKLFAGEYVDRLEFIELN